MSNEIKVRIETSSPVADTVHLKTVKYDDLTNKPKINGVELDGDKSTADLGIDIDTSKYATKDDLQNKADKKEIPTVPTNVSAFENDAGYLTEHQDISGKINKTEAGIAGGIATLDSNAKVPMSQINDSLLGNVQYQGLYNASTNTPNLDTVATKGHYYIVSAAGERFGIKFEVGDWIISDGTNWTKVDNTDAVSSVNGRTGNVVITKEDLDLSEYVKNTDYATSTEAGVILPDISLGTAVNGSGKIYIVKASDANIIDKTSIYNPLTPSNLDLAVKTGVTTNTIELTDEEKITACNWLGTNKTASLTQAEYDALATKDTNTLYLIEEE